MYGFSSLNLYIGQTCVGIIKYLYILVENARKFRESAPNQILIFGEPPPGVGVSENVWFFKFKRVYRAGGDFH